ncbi:hypothetical protein [Paraburkholderia sp. SIMBA_054]|uniref:hypothetical protein n=1 Tax=Paraburkholderia sp. SIMBA_054 TaxID=3085795 RepID=UPI00397C15B6
MNQKADLTGVRGDFAVVNVAAFKKPWICLEENGASHEFDDEAAARAFQREQRLASGRDPMTGDLVGTSMPNAAVVEAYLHVKSLFPEVRMVRYDAQSDCSYTTIDGVAPWFAGHEIDRHLLDDACCSLEDFPVIYLEPALLGAAKVYAEAAKKPFKFWEEKVSEAMNNLRGIKVEFQSNLSNHASNAREIELSGQMVTIKVAGIDPRVTLWHEEALPFLQIQFDDGFVYNAYDEELFSHDKRLHALTAAVCGGFAIARDLGYTGPTALSAQATPEVKREFVNRLDVFRVTECSQGSNCPPAYRVARKAA